MLTYMRHDARLGGFHVHVEDGDQLIAPRRACHNVEPRFRHAENLSQKFNQRFVRFIVRWRRGDTHFDRAVVLHLHDLGAAGARRHSHSERGSPLAIVQFYFFINHKSLTMKVEVGPGTAPRTGG